MKLLNPFCVRVVTGIVVLGGLAGIAAAQTNAELLINPFVPDRNLELKADTLHVFNGDTDNGPYEYNLQVTDVTARYRIDPKLRMDPRVGFSSTMLNINSSDPVLPQTLVDTSVAVGFGIFERDGWVGGLTLGMGYAGVGGDMFGDGNAWYGKASIVVGKKLNKVDTVGVVLDYDGNRTFMPDVPLPGFAWQRVLIGDSEKPTAAPRLLLTLGFPYTSIEWKPDNHLTLSMTYAVPDDFSARADYDLSGTGKFGVYAALDARRTAYHSDDVPGDDRIFFYQRRAEAGIRWSPAADMNLLLAGGYAFAQEFTTGFDSRDEAHLAELSDEIYIRFAAQLRF